MSGDKLLLALVLVCVLCVTGLIAQCSYSVGECRKEAIKSGMKAEDIPSICRD